MAVVTITTENFAQEVLHSDKPVLVRPLPHAQPHRG